MYFEICGCIKSKINVFWNFFYHCTDDPLASPHCWQHFKNYTFFHVLSDCVIMIAYLLNYLISSSSSNNYKEGGLCCRFCCACFCLYNCCVTSSTLYWRMQSCRRQIGESSPGGSLSKVTIGRYTRFLSTLCSSGTQWSSNHHSFFIGFNCLVCRLLFFQATATTTGGA